MSLTLLQSTNPIAYELCQPGDGGIYNPFLCTAPRQYREEITSNGILGFYYDSNVDEYVLIIQMKFAAWPSWRINAYHIDPETGLTTSQELGLSVPGIFFARSYENGQLKKVYANRFAGSGSNSIVPVDPVTFELDIANPVVESSDVGGFIMNKFLLNRTNGIVAVQDVSKIRRYNYNTPVQLESISIPEWTPEDMAYEDEARGWAVLSSNTGFPEGLAAMKFNYVEPAVEILTGIQSDGTEILSAIAYDSKRKAVAVFRNMPVATDGASLDKLDIYKPIVQPTNLTAPVPQDKLVPGKTVQFIANLIGDRGEAGSIKPVTITNTGDGTILQPTVVPRTNGSISFQYLVGNNPGSDTITLQVDI
jgi:hypothetical protein